MTKEEVNKFIAYNAGMELDEIANKYGINLLDFYEALEETLLHLDIWEPLIKKYQREAVEKALACASSKIKESFSDENPNASYATRFLREGILDLLAQITPEKILEES